MAGKNKIETDNLLQSILNDPLLKGLGLKDINETEINQAIPTAITQEKLYHIVGSQESEKEKLILEEILRGVDNLSGEIAEIPEEKDATAEVTVAPDRLVAKIKLERPGKRGKALSEEDIFKIIEQEGITEGIENKYISRLAKYPVYGVPFQIAIGKAAVDGKDGYIVPCFEQPNNENADIEKDVIDFKFVDFINQVKEGQLLCDIVLPVTGEDGYDIFGTVLHKKQGSVAIAPNGANTYFSEDKLQLFASCEGHAHLKQGKVSVQKVMIVKDVDYATGNIIFSGDVTVKGDVKNGFFIRAGGNILIEGNVEETVHLQSQGDIVIKKGVNGKGGGIIAGGSLQVGFLQYADINVKENISADSIINCHITCGGDMNLGGRNGRIVGGKSTIGGSFFGRELGNLANIPTEIEIIGPYLLANKKEDVEERIAQCQEAVQKIELLMKDPSINEELSMQGESRKNILKAMVSKRQLEGEITKLMEQASSIATEIKGKTVGNIHVMGNLYSNVHINIDGDFYHNSDRKSACTISNQNNKISIS